LLTARPCRTWALPLIIAASASLLQPCSMVCFMYQRRVGRSLSFSLANSLLADCDIFCFKWLCHRLWHFFRPVVRAAQFCNGLLQNWRDPVFTGKANHVPDISLGEPFDLRQLVFKIGSEPRDDPDAPPFHLLALVNHPAERPMAFPISEEVNPELFRKACLAVFFYYR